VAEHGIAEDEPARIEIAVQKYRREQEQQRQRRSRRRWILLIFAAVILGPCCCCGIFIYGETNLPAEIAMRLTKYPGAQKIKVSRYFGGSAPVSFDYHIYWTEDSVSSVIDHYEKVFPHFEQDTEPEWWSRLHEEVYPVFYRSSGFLDMTILVLDAEQGSKWIPVTSNFWVEIPDDSPHTGTLIVVAFFTTHLD
jgi:hypothetical protein